MLLILILPLPLFQSSIDFNNNEKKKGGGQALGCVPEAEETP